MKLWPMLHVGSDKPALLFVRGILCGIQGIRLFRIMVVVAPLRLRVSDLAQSYKGAVVMTYKMIRKL